MIQALVIIFGMWHCHKNKGPYSSDVRWCQSAMTFQFQFLTRPCSILRYQGDISTKCFILCRRILCRKRSITEKNRRYRCNNEYWCKHVFNHGHLLWCILLLFLFFLTPLKFLSHVLTCRQIYSISFIKRRYTVSEMLTLWRCLPYTVYFMHCQKMLLLQ